MTILAYEGANEKQIQSNKYSFEGQPNSNLTQVTSILQMTSPYSAFEHLPYLILLPPVQFKYAFTIWTFNIISLTSFL